MKLKERKYRVLVVSSQPKMTDALLTVLKERRRCSFDHCTGVGAARRQLLEQDYDMLLVNAPLTDDDGIRFSIDITASSNSSVLLLIGADNYPEIFEIVCHYGVYTLAKPTTRHFIEQGLDWLECSCERLSSISEKTLSVEEKMQEIRKVNRAKWLLISKLGISEEEAHRQILGTAMNSGRTKLSVAEELISIYG